MSGLPVEPVMSRETLQPSPVLTPRSTQAVEEPQTPDLKSPPLRAFENQIFMTSKAARLPRIMCEFLETEQRIREEKLHGTIVFFGSARTKSTKAWNIEMTAIDEKLAEQSPDDVETQKLRERKATLLRLHPMCEITEKVKRLAKLVGEWSTSDEARRAVEKILHVTISPKDPSPLAICTGGGPGFMEAANSGAKMTSECRSMGLGITLPFESHLNAYVDHELSIRYHYFFARKYWLCYLCLGVVAAPGGFGTLDEIMELLTLRSTGRFKQPIPIVLFGVDFWKKLVNFEYLLETGMISQKDYDMLFWTDSEDEALAHIRQKLCSREVNHL